MAGVSPTARTLEFLRNNDIPAGVVERFIKIEGQRHGQRKDLFGIIDVIAIPHDRTIGIQVCAVSGLSAHRNKMRDNSERVGEWLACDCRALEIWAWRKLKVQGQRRSWWPRIERVTFCQADGKVAFERMPELFADA